MKLLYLAMLAGLPLAGVVAWRMGGAPGAGTFLGSAVAIAIGMASIAWQEHLLRRRPALAMNAMVIGFLAKLIALLVGAVGLRFIASAADFADWSSYLLGFAAATLWVMVLGSLRHLRSMRASKEPSAS